MKRPTTAGTYTTTPLAGTMLQLLGPGISSESLTLTRQEFEAVQKLYGFTKEKPNQKPPPPEPPKLTGDRWKDQLAREDHQRALDAHAKWEDPRAFLQAGADRNAMRHARADGTRMLVWLAKFVDAGQDPLKLLIQMASDAGYDVDPNDYEWATNEDGDEADQEPERRAADPALRGAGLQGP